MSKLYRSKTNSWFTGLCGGLGEYFGISATWVRLLAVIGAVCSFGTALLVYVIASFVIPKPTAHYPYH